MNVAELIRTLEALNLPDAPVRVILFDLERGRPPQGCHLTDVHPVDGIVCIGAVAQDNFLPGDAR